MVSSSEKISESTVLCATFDRWSLVDSKPGTSTIIELSEFEAMLPEERRREADELCDESNFTFCWFYSFL